MKQNDTLDPVQRRNGLSIGANVSNECKLIGGGALKPVTSVYFVDQAQYAATEAPHEVSQTLFPPDEAAPQAGMNLDDVAARRRRESCSTLLSVVQVLHETVDSPGFAVHVTELVEQLDRLIDEFGRLRSEEIFAAVLQAVADSFLGPAFARAASREHLDVVEAILTIAKRNEHLTDRDLQAALDAIRDSVGTTLAV